MLLLLHDDVGEAQRNVVHTQRDEPLLLLREDLGSLHLGPPEVEEGKNSTQVGCVDQISVVVHDNGVHFNQPDALSLLNAEGLGIQGPQILATLYFDPLITFSMNFSISMQYFCGFRLCVSLKTEMSM